jgi:hypothetical protein
MDDKFIKLNDLSEKVRKNTDKLLGSFNSIVDRQQEMMKLIWKMHFYYKDPDATKFLEKTGMI